MLLHTITGLTRDQTQRAAVCLSPLNYIRFVKFIITEIFPGGRLPDTDIVAGTLAQRRVSASPGASRFSRTTPRPSTCGRQRWTARRDEAIAIQSEEVYDRYMKYLTGCANISASDTSTSISSRWKNKRRWFAVCNSHAFGNARCGVQIATTPTSERASDETPRTCRGRHRRADVQWMFGFESHQYRRRHQVQRLHHTGREEAERRGQQDAQRQERR